ncbi:G5 domain-containing protein [Granulicatella elegans]|uniref:G5 domain-containing protein n=1 Tax=Granulicatella elegans TaxID=137732 RepID=UPI001D15474D|nr:G5 domain-containing protein [Granulicatella elegans]UEA31347.1 G5 domain-containing protein [Granulicatella elegans]
MTEYIYDENVEMGKEEEVKPGEKGKVTITTSYDKDQNKLVTKEETKDPVKRVVKVGIKPVVQEEKIPHDTEYEYNPELKAGEVKKIQDGTPGKVTITTTFNKETGKIETKVERTEPTNAKYEYGSKTEGKVKVESEIPFEVEIIKDPEMEAGKTETAQEGKLGKKEITITIENSKEVSREENVTEKPVKKIVKVGTKCKCEKPDNPPAPGKDPEKPENPKDLEKPGKENPKYPEKPGEEKPNKPGTPGEKPNKPGTPGEKPNKPGRPSEDPFKEPGEDYASDNEGSESVKGKNIKSSKKDYSKAPKTYDPGIGGYVGATGIAGILLAYLQKKKKEDKKD